MAMLGNVDGDQQGRSDRHRLTVIAGLLSGVVHVKPLLRPVTGYGHPLRYVRAAQEAITHLQPVFPTCYGLELTAELPGIAEQDVDVSLSGTTLTIKGEKSADKTVSEKDRHVSERSYGSFRRVMTLPFEPEMEQVEAHMENGVLTLALPRPALEAENAKKIEVKRKG